MPTYLFEVDDETWREWKKTVPRTKTLDERLIELIEADTEGRIVDETRSPTEPGYDLEAELEDVEFPTTVDRADAIATIRAARDYLQEHDSATMRDFVTDVMPDYPLGYDVPDLKEGERYRGSWWRKVIRPGLEALPDVEAPSEGRREWKFIR